MTKPHALYSLLTLTAKRAALGLRLNPLRKAALPYGRQGCGLNPVLRSILCPACGLNPGNNRSA